MLEKTFKQSRDKLKLDKGQNKQLLMYLLLVNGKNMLTIVSAPDFVFLQKVKVKHEGDIQLSNICTSAQFSIFTILYTKYAISM